MGVHNTLVGIGSASAANLVDPGSGGTYRLRGQSLVYSEITTAGAEARTVPAPTQGGQIAIFAGKTLVGACTITFTGGINPNGDTTFVLTNAGDYIIVVSVRTAASTYVWRKVADHGLADLNLADAAVLESLNGLTATVDEINAVADVSGRVVVNATTQVAVTAAAHGDRDLVLTNTATVTVTLPAATGTGYRYRIISGATPATGNKIINTSLTTEAMNGASLAVNTQSTTIGFIATATDNTITLNGTTTGGVIGTVVELLDRSTGLWLVNIFNITTGNPATPFSEV